MKDRSAMIMSISTMDDIKKLKDNPEAKYLNIDITTPDLDVISYLLENGEQYSYADMIDEKKGYIYVSYDIFKESELLLLDIVKGIPDNLNELETARYLYITLGKIVGYDINILPDKNETFNLKTINTINNIWGCLYQLKGTNVSFSKVYLYLCRLKGIDCELITANNIGYLKNIINVDGNSIITDITQDIPYIQASFKTRNFIGYNDNIELDKKINYIKDDYSEVLIEKSLKKIDYNNEQLIKEILLKTQNIINVNNMKSIELGIIYDLIFQKYCPNYDIYINNLFVNSIYDNKKHFILISYDNNFYSYNYSEESFVEISSDDIVKNIENKKIGVYLNEKIPIINNSKEKAI